MFNLFNFIGEISYSIRSWWWELKWAHEKRTWQKRHDAWMRRYVIVAKPTDCLKDSIG